MRDLVVGSDLRFVDAGAHALKGVPGEWRVLWVADGASSDSAPLSIPAAGDRALIASLAARLGAPRIAAWTGATEMEAEEPEG